jgi:cytochrome P450
VLAVCGQSKGIEEEHLHQLKYLEAVINESLRIYSPVGGPTARVATEDLVIDDYFVPKGVFSLPFAPDVNF